jgi:hypothetical protein
MSQLIAQTPTNRFNTSGVIIGNWYPSCRPLKTWRKTLGGNLELNGTAWRYGADTAIAIQNNSFTFQNNVVSLNKNPYSFDYSGKRYTLASSSPDLKFVSTGSPADTIVFAAITAATCDVASTVYETPLKNIKPSLTEPCNRGSIISFSGFANIKPVVACANSVQIPGETIQTKNYHKFYANNYQYLRSRGNTYQSNSSFHTITGVAYAEGTHPVWPVRSQTLADGTKVTSAEFSHNGATCNPSKYTVYKPNNPSFSKQGAVSSSTRLLKIKYAERVEITPFQKKALQAQLKK